MDVGVVTPRYPPNVEGGGEISAQMLAEQLRHDPRVDRTLVLSFDGAEVEQVNGVEVCRLGEVSSTLTEWQNVRAYRPLAANVSGLDLVHAYNMELHPAVGVLGCRRNIPTVATLNSYHFLPKSVSNTSSHGLGAVYERVGHPTTGRVLRWLMARIDRFVAISTAVKNIYVDHGIDDRRIEVIPNMSDPSFSIPTRAPTDEGTTLLYIGELSERKGVEYLVRALRYLPASYRLRVVGDGAEFDALRGLTDRLGLRSRVTFVGRVPYDRIGAQYATADVFVHPGVWPEPFGRTVMEAMQASLPVVCTDVGGPADIVPDSELHCPPRDPTALAEAILRATENRSAYGDRNRTRVKTDFSPEVVTAKVIDLYESVL